MKPFTSSARLCCQIFRQVSLSLGAASAFTALSVQGTPTFSTLVALEPNTMGRHSQASLMQGSGGALYGTAVEGGAFGQGTLFRVNLDGTGFTLLHSFGPGDGTFPVGGVTEDAAGVLFGTTSMGGASGFGTIFRVNSDGTGYTLLRSLSPADGVYGGQPTGRLVEDGGGRIVGVLAYHGPASNGSVFRMNKDGTGFTVVKAFTGADGQLPLGGLIRASDGAFYGTTAYGGAAGAGTVFRISGDGTTHTVLWNFAGGAAGASPRGALLEAADGALYGTTMFGGPANWGSVFRIQRDGTGFTQIKTFNTYAEGSASWSELVQAPDGSLVGTANNGGPNFDGEVFNVAPDGSGFSVLKSFMNGTADGSYPFRGLVRASDNNLYGITYWGGAYDSGTIYRVSYATEVLSFAGFLAPIGGADATGGGYGNPVRSFKAGSTVPVKFALTSAGSPVTTGTHTLQAVKWTSATISQPPIDATPQDTATTGNQFVLKDGAWQFNLDTRATGIGVGQWQLIATLSDGSTHSVWIQIK